MLPAQLGRYEILRELGRGAMGRVFLAHDPRIDRKVAIKTVQSFAALPERARAEARERFLREARAAGKLLHPGIVTLFDAGEADGMLYLAMEWVEGTTLDAFVSPERLLPVPTVVELVAAVAEALGYAHRAGIVHRDIKPANLMRTPEGTVKIMDFGLARSAEAQLTHDGALLGTPSYMAPEQIRGAAVDGRSDLFSLSVVLYELLTGERPFGGDSISSIIYRIVNEPPHELPQSGDRVPQPLHAFLLRALAKSPQERYPSAEDYARSLRQAAGVLAPAMISHEGQRAAPVPREPVRVQAPPRTRLWPYVSAVLALLAILGGGVYAFREALGLSGLFGKPEPVWWQAQVRTEPAGLPLELDGKPLDPSHPGVVRFKPEGPFGLLRSRLDCRTAEHQLTAADAGTEVVLVLDPVKVDVPLDPGVAGAAVRLNGAAAGSTPLSLPLDLCRVNRVELAATGYRPAATEIAAGAKPLDARTLVASLALDAIPRGRLKLPAAPVPVEVFVDGERRQPVGGELELTEGAHEVRVVAEEYWLDLSRSVTIEAGRTIAADLAPPRLATLVVQTFPPNCKVYARRPGGDEWRYLEETPMQRRLAPGDYELKVDFEPTGQSRLRRVKLRPGANLPVRLSLRAGA